MHERPAIINNNVLVVINSLQPSDHRVLGASLRKRRLFVPQGPEETGVDQSETTVRLGYLVPGFCRSIREYYDAF